ncbi:hypothetical protein CIG19_06605 [Enterobacterales bacterium CwR94]|nr:hypothetical protein CIG19_06605 [Enterobacterales bacterium CwR94]
MTIRIPSIVSRRFKNPENLQALRTALEIARNNGSEWSRELPPRPVLPPYGPLEKISGVLEAFSSESYEECFDADRYRTFQQPQLTESQRVGGAAMMTLVGNSATAGAFASDDDDKSLAEYVQGVINGKPFRGWVGLTRLKAGDEVEIIADWQEDHYEVYAIILPSERIISVCPRCVWGRYAKIWLRIKYMFAFIFLMLLTFSIAYFLGDDGFFDENYFILLAMGYCVSQLFAGAIAWFAYQAYKNTTCKLAEEIFSLIGLPSPKSVSLNKVTNIHERKLKKKGEWRNPADKTGEKYPSNKFVYSMEYWFYY